MTELIRDIPIPDFPDTKLLSRNSDGNIVTLWHRPESVPPLLYVTVYDTNTGTEHPIVEVKNPSTARERYEHAFAFLSDGPTRAVVRSYSDAEIDSWVH